jgi:hypothetical protein
MAHLTATSNWLVLLPGLILAGIGLGITSTGLASAALSAVEPARAGMGAGLTNTLRQAGTATGVALFGALYASRVSSATLDQLAGVPAAPDALQRLAAAVASGAGTRVADAVPPTARAAVALAARTGTASGLNDVLLAAAAFAAIAAVVGFAYGPDPARQAPPIDLPTPPVDLPAQPAPAHHQTQHQTEQHTQHPRCVRLEVGHIDLARVVSPTARRHGGVADRAAAQRFCWRSAKPEAVDVVGFWRAVLG